MPTKINMLNTKTIIYKNNFKRNTKHIYTAKHINNANNNSLIKKKQTNSTTKTKTKITRKNKKKYTKVT